MFLVEKSNYHFKSLTKKPPQIILIPKLQSAQSFDDFIISHLKTLTLSSTSSITLSWMAKAVTFLTTIHTAAYNQIDTFRSEKFIPDFMTSYMDYSLKVLDLCNLMTSAVKDMTERKMLMKLALRLVKSGDNSSEKMKKAKEVLRRCVECTRARGDEETSSPATNVSDEKYSRANVLIGELISGACRLPVGEVSNGAGVVRRTLHA
ncbi:hypothetical protein Tco_1130018, partial [Tanacetum coccineum]